MEEVRAIPWNGLTVASTFSGAGGSCTGYRMAGYRVVWANEFVPAAQDSYEANASAQCYLDKRDIAVVQPEEILERTGLEVGELDLFDGSPPCQAFSTAGKREKGWGEDKRYEHGAAQKNETLFDEYVRLLRGLMPRAFVAENVSGLIKGTAKGYFLEILAALKASGYRVTCRVLDAQWLGVPQQRQRTIFVGVREDLGLDPVHPKPLAYRYSVRDALPHLSHAGYHRGEAKPGSNWQPHNKDYDLNRDPCGTIPASVDGCFEVTGTTEMIVGNEAFKPKRESLDGPSSTLMAAGPHGGSGQLRTVERESRATAIQGKVYDKTKPGDSFDTAGKDLGYRGGFTKIKIDGKKACAAVTTAPDLFHPTEKRKFAIAELKRICAFPDDFILTGSYAQQWARLGNSVPPVMMRAIAETIRDEILRPSSTSSEDAAALLR